MKNQKRTQIHQSKHTLFAILNVFKHITLCTGWGIFFMLVILRQGLAQTEYLTVEDEFNLPKEYLIWVDSFPQLYQEVDVLNQHFQPLVNQRFSKLDYAYWLYFKLENNQETPVVYWLSCGVFDSLTLVTKINRTRKIQQRGLLIDYNSLEKQQFQSLLQDKYGFELSIAPHTAVAYYLRIKNTVRFESSLKHIKIRPKQQQLFITGKRSILYAVFSAAFFGIFVFIVIFSLFQFLQNKDLAYIYYALYLSMSTLYYWWKFEKSNSFLNIIFTPFPEKYYYLETPLALIIYLSYFLFVTHFLNAKNEIPILYKIIKKASPILLIYIIVNTIGAHFWGLSLSWKMNHWVRFILIPGGIFSIYWVFKSKHQLSFYILTGTLIMLLGAGLTSILSGTLTQHYWGCWDIPLLPVQLGMLIEVFFFSVGLGYKTRLLEVDKNIAHQKLKIEKQEKKHQKEINRLRSTFFTNITHEFRTPLTIIGGITSDLRENKQEVVQQKAMIIQENGEKLLNLVNQLLSLSQLEVGKMDLHCQQGNVINFLHYQVNSFQSIARKQKISLLFYCTSESIIMDFDPDKMQIIISNLLSNAFKFTAEYGEILVVVKHFKKNTTESLEIMVKDNGRGIEESRLPYVFDRFYQGDLIAQKIGMGTGIGLALSKELVQLMDGEIKVESKIGEGFTCFVHLPIKQEAKKAFMTKPLNELPIEHSFNNNSTAASPKAPLILLVEDNLDVRMIIKNALQDKYRILEANNGEMGVEMALKHQPHLILSDIMMPIKDGFELCETLKTNEKTDCIPIILITAKATQEDKNIGLQLGADAYLIKPFDKKELLIRVEKILELREKLEARFVQLAGGNGIEEVINGNVFLANVYKILEEQYADESFSSHRFYQKMGLSKSSFYRQLKEETGLSVGLFIRAFRLKKAKKRLLNNPQLSIKEIAYQVGFSSPVYFSQEFKRAYNCSPSEYRQSFGQ